MALPTIAQMVTNRWPTTEGRLSDTTSGVDYATEKDRAIERAKVQLYLDLVVPTAESDIPELARLWIADQAVLLLIHLARDFYMQQLLSEGKQEATTTYYNKIAALDRLEDRLTGSIAQMEDAARDAISAANTRTGATPAVSNAGLPVDALARAMARGPFPL